MDLRLENRKTLRRGAPALLVALLFSGLGVALFWSHGKGQELETDLGLQRAFWLRGEQAPADEVRFVAVSERSAQVLEQPPIDRLTEWDRARTQLRTPVHGRQRTLSQLLWLRLRRVDKKTGLITLFVSGAVFGLTGYLLPAGAALVAVIVLGSAYGALAHRLFV